VELGRLRTSTRGDLCRARRSARLELPQQPSAIRERRSRGAVTDGVTEAEDAHGEQFGEERVVQALQNAAGRSAEEVRRALMAAVFGYCRGQFRDDATVVVLAVE